MHTQDNGANTVTEQPTVKQNAVIRWVHNGGLSTFIIALPLLLIFGFFSFYPIVKELILSFQSTDLGGASEWVGLDNYAWVLTDPDLPIAVKNTLWYVVLCLIIGYPVPLITAVIMNEVKRLKGLYTVLAYLPVIVPPVVSILLWKFFYDASPNGVFNQILGWIGLGPFPWLNDAMAAMPSMVIEVTWATAGGTCILYLAALIGVPTELYEAAEVDGAGIWRKLWNVTLPQMRGFMLITLILQVIGTVQVFNEPYLFTGGGPNKSTLTLMMMVYKYAFGSTGMADFGGAAALSVLVAVFLGAMSVVYFRVTKKWSK